MASQERNRIFGDKSLKVWGVIPGAIEVEAGGVEFATSVGKAVCRGGAGYLGAAEGLERILSLKSAG